jgi:hypothetical protein
MISRALIIASTVGIAMALSAPAHAASFNAGSFMLGSGGKSWIPKCKAPEVLTELKDQAGRSRWVCTVKPTSASNTQGQVRSASAAPR